MRSARNYIDHLVNDNGIRYTSSDGIESIIVQYFSSLFSASNSLDMEEVLLCVTPHVTHDMHEALCKPYNRWEVENVLHQMHPHKAPGHVA